MADGYVRSPKCDELLAHIRGDVDMMVAIGVAVREFWKHYSADPAERDIDPSGLMLVPTGDLIVGLLETKVQTLRAGSNPADAEALVELSKANIYPVADDILQRFLDDYTPISAQESTEVVPVNDDEPPVNEPERWWRFRNGSKVFGRFSREGLLDAANKGWIGPKTLIEENDSGRWRPAPETDLIPTDIIQQNTPLKGTRHLWSVWGILGLLGVALMGQLGRELGKGQANSILDRLPADRPATVAKGRNGEFWVSGQRFTIVSPVGYAFQPLGSDNWRAVTAITPSNANLVALMVSDDAGTRQFIGVTSLTDANSSRTGMTMVRKVFSGLRDNFESLKGSSPRSVESHREIKLARVIDVVDHGDAAFTTVALGQHENGGEPELRVNASTVMIHKGRLIQIAVVRPYIRPSDILLARSDADKVRTSLAAN